LTAVIAWMVSSIAVAARVWAHVAFDEVAGEDAARRTRSVTASRPNSSFTACSTGTFIRRERTWAAAERKRYVDGRAARTTLGTSAAVFLIVAPRERAPGRSCALGGLDLSRAACRRKTQAQVYCRRAQYLSTWSTRKTGPSISSTRASARSSTVRNG